MDIKIINWGDEIKGLDQEFEHQIRIINLGENRQLPTIQHALEFLLEVSFTHPSSWIFLNAKLLPNDFFKLANKRCGELFQKCQNYDIKLIIGDDFASYQSKALLDFQYEINKQGNFLLVENLEAAIKILQGAS